MKIIGVEFRVAIYNQVFGRRQYEVFLHPLDIAMPNDLGQVVANFTVHTSDGDRGLGDLELRPMEYGMHHNSELIKRCVETFERDYFAKQARP
jgi:hypothetical protein